MSQTEQEVRNIVSRITKSPVQNLDPDADLKQTLNVDSLQGLQIVAAIEKKFSITIPDENLDSYTSIRAIVDLLDSLNVKG